MLLYCPCLYLCDGALKFLWKFFFYPIIKKRWDLIVRLNSTICFGLYQARTWTSNLTYCGRFNVEWREVRNDCWLYLHWWNYRPWLPKEEFEDTKGVIIIRKPTDRQHKYFIFIPKVLEHTSGIAYVICHDVNILGILAVYPFGVFKPFLLPPSFNTYHVLKQSNIANFKIFYTTTIGSELQSCLYI